jgi:hypothetical protein
MKPIGAVISTSFNSLGGNATRPSGKRCELCNRPWNFHGNDRAGVGLEIDPAALSLITPCCKARREVLHLCAAFNKRSDNLETCEAFKTFAMRGVATYGRTFLDLVAQAVRDGVAWDQVRDLEKSFAEATREAAYV